MNDFNSEVEKITPEMAEVYLKHNVDNYRPVISSKIRQYADDMKNGNWALTGQPIIFDERGLLADGQNRLHACVLADAPFETLVVRGAPTEAADQMDTGARRTLADVLRRRGEANVHALSGSIRLSWKWDLGTSALLSPVHPTISQSLAWFESNPRVADAIRIVYPTRLNPLKLRVSVSAPFYYRISQIDPDEALFFVDRLATGVGLEETSPVLLLRNRLMQEAARINGGSKAQYVELAFLVKAWNLWITGSETKQLAWRRGGSNKEAFPRLLNAEGEPHPFPGESQS